MSVVTAPLCVNCGESLGVPSVGCLSHEHRAGRAGTLGPQRAKLGAVGAALHAEQEPLTTAVLQEREADFAASLIAFAYTLRKVNEKSRSDELIQLGLHFVRDVAWTKAMQRLADR